MRRSAAMAADVHPIEPEPTYHGAAVRKVGPRRERGEDRRGFAAEVERRAGAEGETPPPPPPRQVDRTVSPPTEEDGGTHVDLLG
ncbi:MAG: hypothetical protein AB1726_11325 [Planctomycetota bacterium]